MSKKSEWKLTENGVQALYKHDFKDEIKVQVIFQAEGNSVCYLRVSDGCHISPIVFITKLIINKFCVGAVIAIKEKRLVGYDEYMKEEKDRFILEDRGLHRVVIESYVVVAGHKEVGLVIGSLDHNTSYREEIRNTLYALLERNSIGIADDQLAWEHGEEASAISQREGGALREQGNCHFKQGKYEEAIAFYDMAKEKDEYDCRVWSNSSHAHYMLKEYLRAELYALIAIKMNPFYEKAYYRAIRAALKAERRAQVETYAKSGIFLCRENKELPQILDENSQAMRTFACQDALLSHFEALFTPTAEFVDISHTTPQKGFSVFKETQQQLMRKMFIDYSSLGKEIKKETKKSTKKHKKPGNEAASGNSKEQEKSREEEKKHVKESKKQKDHKLNLNEALQEGRRLYETDQFHQAIEMYNKYLTSIVSADKINSNVKGKSNESNEMQVIHFIIGMCKVQSSRGYIYDGLETMEYLCDESSKFPNKPAARYWLAVSYEKICCFESALKHAQECKDALMKTKSIKPVKWPKTDQPIYITFPDVLENECKLLLDKPSSARPSPKAKCRYKNCISTQGIKYAKEQIYLTDPDFKGYLNVMCEENCTVSYHPCCWKAYKEQHDSSINRMSDKKLLPSNNTVGAIGTLPPKLVRPQPKTVPSSSKLGGQTNASKDEGAMPSTSSSYTRLIEQCKQRFGKDFSSPEICTALREVRTQNNNSLSGMNTEKILDRVKQQLRSRKQGAGAPSVAPWASLTQGAATKTGPEWQGPSSEEAVKEESCSICLEPLNSSPTLPLQCLHTFHEHCIKGWLKRKSNCPNCRTFALTTDEYPTLTHS